MAIVRHYDYSLPSEGQEELPATTDPPNDPERSPKIILAFAVLTFLISKELSAVVFGMSVWNKGKWSHPFNASPLRFGWWTMLYLIGVFLLGLL